MQKTRVKKCERLHPKRWYVFNTPQNFGMVCADGERLHNATNEFSRLLKKQKSDLSNIATEVEQDSFIKYETKDTQKLKHKSNMWHRSQQHPDFRKLFPVHDHRRALINLMEIFKAQGPSHRPATLREELTHKEMIMWCFSFESHEWNDGSLSEYLFWFLRLWVGEPGRDKPKLVSADFEPTLSHAQKSTTDKSK